MERGNGLLDMVIFTPLALFFLFVATDAGFYLFERSALLNAFGEALVSDAQFGTPLEVNDSFELVINSQRVGDLIRGVADELELAMSHIKTADNTYRVEVSAIIFSVDPDSGELTDYQEAGAPEVRGSFNLSGVAPGYPRKSRSDFLAEQFERTRESRIHAIPIGPVMRRGQVSTRYFDKSLAIYAELTALPDGIAASAVKSSLGEYFALQEQSLVVTRKQS